VGRNDFEGRKVRLRAIEPDEWEQFLVFEGDTDLARLSGLTHLPASRASTRQWAQEASERKEGDQVALRVETLDGALVGWINVGQTDRRNGLFTYAIGIGRDHWRQGYGSEAVVLLLRFYFAELAYRKVETKVYSFNEPSLSFHDYLGFTREGCRRAAHFTAGGGWRVPRRDPLRGSDRPLYGQRPILGTPVSEPSLRAGPRRHGRPVRASGMRVWRRVQVQFARCPDTWVYLPARRHKHPQPPRRLPPAQRHRQALLLLRLQRHPTVASTSTTSTTTTVMGTTTSTTRHNTAGVA